MLTKTDSRVNEAIHTQSLAGKALALGHKHHGFYQVLPRIGVIDGPVEINGWKFIPEEMDNSHKPREIYRHPKLLEDNGIPVLQLIIGHEPEGEKQEPRDYSKLLNAGKAMGAIGIALARALVAGLAAAAYALAMVVAYDPVLIVVLDDRTVLDDGTVLNDGSWICVAEWLA